jgi:hypothetical protein
MGIKLITASLTLKIQNPRPETLTVMVRELAEGIPGMSGSLSNP